MRLMVLLAALVSTYSYSANEKTWTFIKTEQGITIEKRDHQDGLIEIRAQMLFPTRYSAFLLLLEDSDNIPNWIDNASHSRVLQQISSNENIVYTQFAAPWPAKDRDMVTYSRYQIVDGAFELLIKDASDYLPQNPDYIRITAVRARWVLEKLTNGQTHIEYTAFANPGGALPDWLANQLSVDSALATFIGLKRELPDYQALNHPNIDEQALRLTSEIAGENER